MTDRFDISREQLFTKDKSRHLSDARHVLYYLCRERQITSTYTKHYMRDNGYDIDLPSIGHGIRKVEKTMTQDPDYINLVNQLK